MKTSIVWAALPMFVIGLTTSVWAVDMDAMKKKKAETVKGQAENVKKEGGEVKQSAQDLLPTIHRRTKPPVLRPSKKIINGWPTNWMEHGSRTAL